MAKLGVLAATCAAGMIAYVGGRLILRPPPPALSQEDLTETIAEAEALWTVDGAPAT
jgi:hypothetical protein